ncbi:MSHA biogenesis protein MshF [Vibrio mimicus]|uniref:MSHA biogenesis protein MshF n=1 Tax=Vibrio mimicus TaxID=674 RepID=UPI0011D6DC31|nr:MSHA biogenesis protein MshF [Vibrio mimicus]TXZ08910.1 MSHA biogenesis protein MshF [Vibrio mimicus]
MANWLGRSRLMLWALLVLILLSALFSMWNGMSRNTLKTAFEVATLSMTERANLYKQQWFLQGQPPSVHIEGKTIALSPSGWVFPKRDQGVDCEKLLTLLYPDLKVLDLLPTIDGENSTNGYQCRYQYGQRAVIWVELKGRHFAVNINFLL